MIPSKGFTTTATILIVLGLLILGGAGYVAMNPEVLQQTAGESSQEVNVEAETTTASGNEPLINWRFVSAGEVDAMPYTNVTVVVNGEAFDMGRFLGSCSEVTTDGGIDGKGLLIGELSAAQCWFAGGGNEIGVFAHEDGGAEIMVGELSEGEEGAGLFRGNFDIKHTISF